MSIKLQQGSIYIFGVFMYSQRKKKQKEIFQITPHKISQDFITF